MSTRNPDEYFSVFTDLQLQKGESDSPNATAKICGVISSECVDYQGDVVLQEGLDFSYFLRSGFLNDDHKAGPGNVVGEPVRVYPTEVNGKPATAMDGILYLSKPQALAIYETAKAISSSNSTRRLGFSIEGQVLARDPANPKIIRKAKVLHVAVTHAPVNPDSKNLELISRSISSGSDVARPLILSIMDMHPELLKDDFFAALSYIRAAMKGGDPRMDRNAPDYDPAEAAEAVQEGSTGSSAEKSAVGYQTPASTSAPSSGSLAPLVPSNLRGKPSKMKQLSTGSSVNAGSSVNTSATADKGCHSSADKGGYGSNVASASPSATASAYMSTATAKGEDSAPEESSYTPEKQVDRSGQLSEGAKMQDSLTPILDSLSKDTIALLSDNMSAMMKESVSDHFSDKKPAAHISSAQLSALLLRTFPNMSESRAKNVATRLVALAKKRV